MIKKINNLKTVKPDDNWKKNYREILFSQISAGQTASQPKTNLQIIWESIEPKQILADLAKPVWSVSLASLLILAVAVGSVYASKNSKPGDSLYIAKIISEKAQLAITFSEEDKAKLSLEFATNRAKEITQVLQEVKEPENKKNEKVQQLSQNFKNEIKQAKSRLTAIKVEKNQNKEDESQVFGANLGKNNQRMEVAEPSTVNKNNQSQTQVSPEEPTTVNATYTPESANEPDKMLEEAEKLFAEKNYDGTIDKLEEVNKVINQTVKDGQVQGESETSPSVDLGQATSTK